MLLLKPIIFVACVLTIAVLGLKHVDGENVSSHFAVINASESHVCPPWFYYSTMKEKCVCFQNPRVKVDVICTENEALLSFGSCMTPVSYTHLTLPTIYSV